MTSRICLGSRVHVNDSQVEARASGIGLTMSDANKCDINLCFVDVLM